jgi:hypothetical protein
MIRLTHTSIKPYIAELVKAKTLHPYVPPGYPRARRCLFITDEAMKDLISPAGLINLMALRGVVEAELKRWVHNGRVWVDFHGKPRFLKRLCPPPSEIWEMRFTDPRVQLRLFGRFAEPNTVVGTKFHLRQMLGNRGSRQWRQAMSSCETAWNELFPNMPPFVGKTIHEYVTENCDDFPLCAK